MQSNSAAQRLAVISALADGKPHSIAALADMAGLDVARLPDIIAALAGMGLQVTLDSECYQFPEAIELLDCQRITAMLQMAPLPDISVIGEVDSTNTVMRNLPPPPGRAAVCLAEFQHAGRGRLGRSWLTPFASGLCFSVGWTFTRPASQLSGLSLAVGVAVRKALAATGVADVALKWPNDLLLGGGKLGGILVEVLNAADGRAYVITGVGINVALSEAARQAVRQAGGQAAAVADAAGNASRNVLAAAMVNAVAGALQRYEAQGLEAFRDDWNEADAMRDQPVRVVAGSETVQGIARGIDRSGALAVDVAGVRRHFAGGEVSLRRMCDVID